MKTLRLTFKQRLFYLAAWAIVAGVFVYVAWGWVASPVGCEADCLVMQRVWAVFAAVFAPIFADLHVDVRSALEEERDFWKERAAAALSRVSRKDEQ